MPSRSEGTRTLTERVAAELMQIGDVSEFMAEMRRLKSRSGLGYQQLEERARRIGRSLPHSTLATALTRESIPRPDLVEAFVRACGADDDEVAWWLKVHATLTSLESAPTDPAPVTDPPPDPAPGRRRRRWSVGAVAAVVVALTVSGGAVLAKTITDAEHADPNPTPAVPVGASPTATSATPSTVPVAQPSVSPEPAHSPSISPTILGWYRVRPALTYKAKFCFVITDSQDKLVLTQAACSASTELDFRLEPSGGAATPTTARIRPRSARMGTNSCVSVNDTGSFAGIYLRNCGDLNAVQVFVVERTRSTSQTGPLYRFRPAAHPARCLGVAGRSTKAGAAITEQECNGTPSQEFALERA